VELNISSKTPLKTTEGGML